MIVGAGSLPKMGGVCLFKHLTTIAGAVTAGVITHLISKWLDRILSGKQPKRFKLFGNRPKRKSGK